MIIVVVSMAIDLYSFEPRLALWMYLAGLVGLLAIMLHAENHFGAVGADTEFVTPGDWFSLPWSFLAVLLIFLLLTADHALFTRSEGYLT